MIKEAIIGIGNTGNQIASLGKKELNIPVLAINSSEKDLATIEDSIPKVLISDKEGLFKGAGKDRKLAKSLLKDSIMNLINGPELKKTLNDVDVVFVVSSTGGGTGSGTAPLLANIISDVYQNVKCILVGVLPVNNEALSAHVNSLEYLRELYKVLDDQTYMLYDNDNLSDLPSYKILDTINQEIISDMKVIRGDYSMTTKYDSIDDRDMMRLISFPGRIVISRVEDFKEKDVESKPIESMIIDSIKNNAHCEAQRDKKVMATGIITNLSQALTEGFDNNVPMVRDFMGDPVHAFNHIYVNDDRKMPNNVFYIMAGLSAVNDKITSISDRIDDIEEKQKTHEEDDALSNIDLSSLASATEDKIKDSVDDQVNVKSIFDKFM